MMPAPYPAHHPPAYHPGDDLLMEYAAGTLSEPASLVIATHLALCPECRAMVAQFEAVGGALLDDMAPAEVAPDMLQDLLARLDDPCEAPIRARVKPRRADRGARSAPVLPEPLRSYVGGDVGSVRWKPVIRGVEEFIVPVGCHAGETKTRLMRIRPGTTMPRHTHVGTELTLVLAGGFSDEGGHYLRGDLTLSDSEVDHQPVADEDAECICIIVTDAPLRLTGPFLRLLNPFVKF
jgi:putative transcriptional regulator